MANRSLTPEEVATYQADGVVFVPDIIESTWIDSLTRVVDEQLDRPSRWANDGNSGSAKNRMFTDRYLWQSNPAIFDFVSHSGCARLAAQALQSSKSRFYFDHLLVKEPETETPTPWHQDIPYWPFLGSQICSIWVALTPARVENSAMEFVRGSHRHNKYYRAEVFGDRENHVNSSWTGSSQSEPVPDIESNRGQFDIVGWDVQPGDALIFSAWTLHGARGNRSGIERRAAISTRWLGDDAVWHPHDGADPTVNPDQVSVKPGDYPADDRLFPCLWPEQA